jgi:hypothetical protein
MPKLRDEEVRPSHTSVPVASAGSMDGENELCKPAEKNRPTQI